MQRNILRYGSIVSLEWNEWFETKQQTRKNEKKKEVTIQLKQTNLLCLKTVYDCVLSYDFFFLI